MKSIFYSLFIISLVSSPPSLEAQETPPPSPAQILDDKLDQLASQGNVTEMINQLESWLENHPTDADAYLRLGQAHHQNGNDKLATKHWEKAIVHYAHTLQGYHRVVNQCRQAELYEIGIQFILAARNAIKDSATMIWQLAEFYTLATTYDQAITTYIDFIHTAPHYLPIGESYLNRLGGDPRHSQGLLNALQNASTNKKKAKEATLLLASFSLTLGQPDIGFVALDALSSMHNQHDHLFQFAYRYADNGYSSIAKRAFALYIERHSNSQNSYIAQLRLAELYAQENNMLAASTNYQALANRAPKHIQGQEALYHLAAIQLNHLGASKAARDNVKMLLNNYPNGPFAPQARLLLAECALRTNDFASVEQLLTQISSTTNGTNQPSHFQLAELYFFKHDFSQASMLLDSLIATEPQNERTNDALELILLLEDFKDQPQVLKVLAQALLKERQGRQRQAAADWTWLDQHAPANLHQYSLLAQAQMQTAKSPKKALAIYQKLITRYRNSHYALQAHLGQAQLYETQGNKAAALDAYRTALLRFPTNASAPEIRLHIQRLRQAITSEGNS